MNPPSSSTNQSHYYYTSSYSSSSYYQPPPPPPTVSNGAVDYYNQNNVYRASCYPPPTNDIDINQYSPPTNNYPHTTHQYPPSHHYYPTNQTIEHTRYYAYNQTQPSIDARQHDTNGVTPHHQYHLAPQPSYNEHAHQYPPTNHYPHHYPPHPSNYQSAGSRVLPQHNPAPLESHSPQRIQRLQQLRQEIDEAEEETLRYIDEANAKKRLIEKQQQKEEAKKQKLQHQQPKTRQCPHCAKSFETLSGLKSHVEKKHLNSKQQHKVEAFYSSGSRVVTVPLEPQNPQKDKTEPKLDHHPLHIRAKIQQQIDEAYAKKEQQKMRAVDRLADTYRSQFNSMSDDDKKVLLDKLVSYYDYNWHQVQKGFDEVVFQCVEYGIESCEMNWYLRLHGRYIDYPFVGNSRDDLLLRSLIGMVHYAKQNTCTIQYKREKHLIDPRSIEDTIQTSAALFKELDVNGTKGDPVERAKKGLADLFDIICFDGVDDSHNDPFNLILDLE